MPSGSSRPWAWPWNTAKNATMSAREPDWRTHLGEHHGAQNHGRDRNAGLDPGKRDAEQSHQSAKRHHQGKATGSTQIAGVPSTAPHSPTATIATT